MPLLRFIGWHICLKSSKFLSFLLFRGIVSCDNQSTIYLTHNLIFHKNTEYIGIDCHVICENVTNDLIHLLLVSFANQFADVFSITQMVVTFR